MEIASHFWHPYNKRGGGEKCAVTMFCRKFPRLDEQAPLQSTFLQLSAMAECTNARAAVVHSRYHLDWLQPGFLAQCHLIAVDRSKMMRSCEVDAYWRFNVPSLTSTRPRLMRRIVKVVTILAMATLPTASNHHGPRAAPIINYRDRTGG